MFQLQMQTRKDQMHFYTKKVKGDIVTDSHFKKGFFWDQIFFFNISTVILISQSTIVHVRL